jgi:hypothetical protein
MRNRLGSCSGRKTLRQQILSRVNSYEGLLIISDQIVVCQTYACIHDDETKVACTMFPPLYASHRSNLTGPFASNLVDKWLVNKSGHSLMNGFLS